MGKKVAEYQISLKVFLKNEKGETLILKTPDNSSFHGKYDFPGGRIDEDEFDVELKDILRREIEEEIGDVKVILSDEVVAVARHRAVYPHKTDTMFYSFWEGRLVSGNINISHEHSAMQWVKIDEINLEEYFESGMLDAAKMYLGK